VRVDYPTSRLVIYRGPTSALTTAEPNSQSQHAEGLVVLDAETAIAATVDFLQNLGTTNMPDVDRCHKELV
jgi:hypothetical protein